MQWKDKIKKFLLKKFCCKSLLQIQYGKYQSSSQNSGLKFFIGASFHSFTIPVIFDTTGMIFPTIVRPYFLLPLSKLYLARLWVPSSSTARSRLLMQCYLWMTLNGFDKHSFTTLHMPGKYPKIWLVLCWVALVKNKPSCTCHQIRNIFLLFNVLSALQLCCVSLTAAFPDGARLQRLFEGIPLNYQ